jgi:hypothetical protein
MTIDEYKTEYPQDQLLDQIDNDFFPMTDEEYEAWVISGVDAINNPIMP